jgi:5-deoxy-glucuronate isomerase
LRGFARYGRKPVDRRPGVADTADLDSGAGVEGRFERRQEEFAALTQSTLLVRPSNGGDNYLHRVTRKSAGWRYVGFATCALKEGGTTRLNTETDELCVVMLAGKARVRSADFDSGIVGERASVFEGLPWSVYVPPKREVVIEAATDCEVALCTSPASGKLPPRVIPPSEVATSTRGSGTNTRHIRDILPQTAEAESLLVVEVITPGGNWSSYPPHKHDRDALPDESSLEETYYHRLSPPQGFAVQRVYTDDRSLDETFAVADRDVVLVPRGYHPVGAAHGYDLYYLNVMAGPKRVWRFHNDPAHAWLMR